jgi:hypothetical protein
MPPAPLLPVEPPVLPKVRETTAPSLATLDPPSAPPAISEPPVAAASLIAPPPAWPPEPAVWASCGLFTGQQVRSPRHSYPAGQPTLHGTTPPIGCGLYPHAPKQAATKTRPQKTRTRSSLALQLRQRLDQAGARQRGRRRRVLGFLSPDSRAALRLRRPQPQFHRTPIA